MGCPLYFIRCCETPKNRTTELRIKLERLFFAYSAEPPLLRETLAAAAARAESIPQVHTSTSWEELRVDGRLIINEVEAKIRDSTICFFDVTTLNNNVLFELGYAIGSEKRVILLLDTEDRDAKKRWADFGLLSTTGFTGYQNIDHLHAEVAKSVANPGEPLWGDLFRGVEASLDESRLLYIPSTKVDAANKALSRVLDQHKKFQSATLNLEDYGSYPLVWFIEQIYSSYVAVFHLTPTRGYLADIANPRISLLAGVAHGLGREVMIAIEAEQPTAIDYRDLSVRYRTAQQIENAAREWLENLRSPATKVRTRVRKHLSAELASLRFGNPVAESDEEGLDSYFVETSDYRSVVNAHATVFTGKKGTGKTANMLQAAEELKQDARNLVCVVKPASYEIEGLIDILRQVDSRHLDQYLIEAMWKYLIYTELSSRAVEEAEARPAGIAKGSPLDALRECLDEEHLGPDASFSVRLERLVSSLGILAECDLKKESIGEARKRINAALYGGTLKRLRSLIGGALSDRKRVAILLDNLDKAWERGADFDLLARLLLGLLTTVGRVVDEFDRENPSKARVPVTLTVFLRSDIYSFVRERAREPDKIPVAEIQWFDQDLLARVLEDRFLASRGSDANAEALWNEYFVASVDGVSSRDFILSTIQPRPRDVVFFANAAVLRAENAKHAVIDESDIRAAQKQYSQFAYEALVVEGLASVPELDSILLEFAGEESILSSERINELIDEVPGRTQPVDEVVTNLRRLGFIGIETYENKFDYGGTDGEISRANVLSRKLKRALGRTPTYQVHAAYCAFLEIREK